MSFDFKEIARSIYKESFLAKEIFADKLMDEEEGGVEFDSASFSRKIQKLSGVFDCFMTEVGKKSRGDFYPFVRKNGKKYDIFCLDFQGIPVPKIYLDNLSFEDCLLEFKRIDSLKGQGKSIANTITDFNKLLTLDVDQIKNTYQADQEDESFDFVSSYLDDLLYTFENILFGIDRKFKFLVYTDNQESAINKMKDALLEAKRTIYTSDKDVVEVKEEIVNKFNETGINSKINFKDDTAAFKAIFAEIEKQYTYLKSFNDIYNSSFLDKKTKLLFNVINSQNDLLTLLNEFKANDKLVFSEETIRRLSQDDISTVEELLNQSKHSKERKVYKKELINNTKQNLKTKEKQLEELVKKYNENPSAALEAKIEKTKQEIQERKNAILDYENSITEFPDKMTEEENKMTHNNFQSFLNFIDNVTSRIQYSTLLKMTKEFANSYYARVKLENGKNLYTLMNELYDYAKRSESMLSDGYFSYEQIPDDMKEELKSAYEKIMDMKKSREELEINE